MINDNNNNYVNEAESCCDLCGDDTLTSEINDNSPYLCMDCSQRIERLEDGIIKDSIIKFAIGNVC